MKLLCHGITNSSLSTFRYTNISVFNSSIFISGFHTSMPLLGVNRSEDFYEQAIKTTNYPTESSKEMVENLATAYTQMAKTDHSEYARDMAADSSRTAADAAEEIAASEQYLSQQIYEIAERSAEIIVLLSS